MTWAPIRRRPSATRPESPLGAWAPVAFSRIEALAATAPGALGDDLRASLARVARTNGGVSLASALAAPAATPFLRAVDGYLGDVGLSREGPAAVDLGEGALATYLHVRLQDDVVDEPRRFGPRFVYAADAWCVAAAAAFARALPNSAPFFAFRAAVLTDFFAAAAEEVEARARKRPLDGSAIGDKFLPLAIPLGAVAFAAGRGSDGPTLVRFARSFGEALQLVNDALNAREDHEARRPSALLAALYAEHGVGPGTEPATLLARLAASKALDDALVTARAALFSALETALAMNAPALGALASERTTFLASVRGRLLALQLGGAFPE